MWRRDKRQRLRSAPRHERWRRRRRRRRRRQRRLRLRLLLGLLQLGHLLLNPLAQPLHLRHVMHEAVSMGRPECECEKVRASRCTPSHRDTPRLADREPCGRAAPRPPPSNWTAAEKAPHQAAHDEIGKRIGHNGRRILRPWALGGKGFLVIHSARRMAASRGVPKALPATKSCAFELFSIARRAAVTSLPFSWQRWYAQCVPRACFSGRPTAPQPWHCPSARTWPQQPGKAHSMSRNTEDDYQNTGVSN